MEAENLARLFHETYEELAPNFGYETRKASAKPWCDVPENNRKLMIAVAEKILSVKKKQTAEDCIEDCAVVDDNKDLRELLRYSYNLPMNEVGDYDEYVEWKAKVEQTLKV